MVYRVTRRVCLVVFFYSGFLFIWLDEVFFFRGISRDVGGLVFWYWAGREDWRYVGFLIVLLVFIVVVFWGGLEGIRGLSFFRIFKW